MILRRLLSRIARSRGWELLDHSHAAEFRNNYRDFRNLVVASGIIPASSNAQNAQDLIVVLASKFKTDGFFVEFGATDGLSLSNTYLLEKHFGWRGILAEPAPVWHEALAKNRTAAIDHACIWSRTGETVDFTVYSHPEFSGIRDFHNTNIPRRRGHQTTHKIPTLSLLDLLQKYEAPRHIDFLSIDTEGTEFEILQTFDFSSYEISIVVCEHNFGPNRERIRALLERNGFTRRLSGMSGCDDWYFGESVVW